MKVGLSLLSGDHVRAEDIGYDDVATRQIACPVCKEALVKAVNAHKAGVTHYLRHRRRPATELERNAERRCELRAMWIRQQMDQSDDPSMPQGQTMGSFLAAFSKLLDVASRTHRMMMLGVDWDETDEEVTPSPRLMLLLENWFEGRRSDNDRLVGRATGETGDLRQTPMDRSLPQDVVDRHYAMVRDLWTHLGTSDAKPNLAGLLVRACGAAMDEARSTLSDILNRDSMPEAGGDPAVVGLDEYLDAYVRAERGGRISAQEGAGGFLMSAAWLSPLVDGSGNMGIATSRRRLTKQWPKLTQTTLDGGAWQSVLHYALKLLRLMVLLADAEHRDVIVREWTLEPGGEKEGPPPQAGDGTATTASIAPTPPTRITPTTDRNPEPPGPPEPQATSTDARIRRALRTPSRHGLAIRLEDGSWATVEMSAEEILDVLERRNAGEAG